MDIVTLGAALNGSAEYVNSHFKGGSNIQIVDNPDGTQTINASGEVSSEDTVARAEIAAIKNGETLDSFGDVETALGDKADTLTTYTKTEVDTALSAKANSADVYSKTAVDTALGNKADKSATYTKTEVDTALNAKANATDVYSKSDVDTALDGKVDKETGKRLSTNDYTNAEKTKLAGIEAQANKTTVDDALSGSSTNPIQNKVVKSALDSKADASTTYTKTEVDTALSGKQNAIDSSHKLSADLVDDTSTTNKFATAAELEQIQTNKSNISTANAELIELVDSGAKNLWSFGGSIEKASSGTAISTAFTLKAGTYVFSCKIASGGTGSTQLKFTDGSSSGTTVATQTWSNTTAGTMSFTYTLTSDATYVVMYTNGSFSYTECMLCSKAAWDVSQKFVPYLPTYEDTVEQVAENENNILSLNQASPYNMAGTYSSETGRASFAELYKLALDSLGLDTSVLHHYIVHVYTNTVSPTADLLIMYGTYYYNNSISHAVLYNSQLSYYADNKQGTLLVSGGDDTIHASVRFLD